MNSEQEPQNQTELTAEVPGWVQWMVQDPECIRRIGEDALSGLVELHTETQS